MAPTTRKSRKITSTPDKSGHQNLRKSRAKRPKGVVVNEPKEIVVELRPKRNSAKKTLVNSGKKKKASSATSTPTTTNKNGSNRWSDITCINV